MTKEEKIKEAWCNQYLGKIDKNGWANIGYCVNGLDDVECWLSDNFFKGKLDKWEISYSELDNGVFINTRIRPISLQGIGKNNGWVKIESEADLPKEYGEYYFRTTYNTMITYSGWYSSSDKKFYDRNHCFEIVDVTHFQPIIKPKPPVY